MSEFIERRSDLSKEMPAVLFPSNLYTLTAFDELAVALITSVFAVLDDDFPRDKAVSTLPFTFQPSSEESSTFICSAEVRLTSHRIPKPVDGVSKNLVFTYAKTAAAYRSLMDFIFRREVATMNVLKFSELS